jgi:predicted small metal-binding protein
MYLGYAFKCSSLGLNCNFEATGNTAEEVVKKASVHAMEAHRAEAMSLASKVRDAIKKT